MAGTSSLKTTPLRYRLLFLGGVVLSGCICVLIGVIFYRPDPPADSLVYIYKQNEAIGVFTVRPDGKKPFPLYYSKPTPSRFVNLWQSAPQALKRPLLPLIEQEIPHHPTWLAGGSQISFRVRVHGRGCDEIIMMDANGENSQPVLCLGRDYKDEAITWSPDGEKLAIARWEINQTLLKLLNSRGNLIHEMYFPVKVWGISWSPDSKRMAVTVDDSASLQIIHQDFATRYFNPENPAFGQPTWSPTGDQVAFFCNSNQRIDICTINANGTGNRRISFPQDFPYLKYNLSWSPAGESLVFEVIQPGGHNDLFLINVNGTNLRQLTFHPAADTQPAWSPDGSQIVFVSLRDKNWEIYTIQADGTGLSRVTNTPGDEREPSWRPGSP